MAPSKRKQKQSSADIIADEEAKEIRGLRFAAKVAKSNIEKIGKSVLSNDEPPAVLSTLKTKLSVLLKNYEEFKSASQLLSSLSIDLEELFQECEYVEETTLETRTLLESLLDTSQPAEPVPGKSAAATVEARLPQIDLPRFDGTPEKWTPFFQLFESLIHQRQLNNLVKFHYLLGALEGKALDVIKEFPLTEGNYTEAYALLKKRFDNPRIQVDRLLGALFALPPTTAESADAVRTLLDKATSIVKALENIGYSLDKLSNVIVVRVVSRKLDLHTKELYESSAETHTFDELQKFLEKRILIVESLGKPKAPRKAAVTDKPVAVGNPASADTRNRSRAFVTTATATCAICSKSHDLSQCESFIGLKAQDRWNKVKELRMCVRCLKPGHFVKDCQAPACTSCQRNHHSLLHFEFRKPVAPQAAAAPRCDTAASAPTSQFELRKPVPPQTVATPRYDVTAPAFTPSTTSNNILTHCVRRSNNGILPTACVLVKDRNGQSHIARALLDQCSTDHLMSKACAQRLGLLGAKHEFSTAVTGVGDSPSRIISTADVEIASMHSSYSESFEVTVLERITSFLPVVPINATLKSWIQNRGVPLADPYFAEPDDIDLLIGVDLFSELNDRIEIDVPQSRLHLAQTRLGWVVYGSWGQQPQKEIVCNVAVQLEKFWEIEELPSEAPVSEEHRQCEEHFRKTHCRLPTGRFVVRLPLSDRVRDLKSARKIAINRLFNLERRGMSEEYRSFMTEYRQLGHMQPVPPETGSPPRSSFYLPHHGVHSAGKLRVVFNASAKSESGLSLNDCMLVGPTIQPTLFTILLRFRSYRYVLATDIIKMYRQIYVAQEDQDLQRIVWRESPTQPLKEFRLATVTYGTASAPFLAIRSLFQLVEENADEFPLAAAAIRGNSYVDDILAGAASLEETLRLRDELIALLAKGCFQLSKWCGNHRCITEFGSTPVVNLVKNSLEQTKALGLEWNSRSDTLRYSSCSERLPPDESVSKRYILSAVSKVFDPLGLVTPILMRGKILIQRSWLSSGGWDDPVPDDLRFEFKDFYNDLSRIECLSIDRFLNIVSLERCELHVFADASNVGMGAAVYVRESVGSDVQCSLVCAKSRVAPLKPMVIARKELCAAVIGARLITRVAAIFDIPISRSYAWSDSTTVLAWLAKPPTTWKPFVANRVAEIHSLIPGSQWRKIPGKFNPADVASRSCTVTELLEHPLWWNGPPEEHFDHTAPLTFDDHAEEVSVELRSNPVRSFVTAQAENCLPIFRISSYFPLLRTVAYVLRFVRNARSPRHRRTTGPLSAEELSLGLYTIVRFIQITEFPDDYFLLKGHQRLSNRSRLLSLNPLIDDTGVIRVGGRLEHAALDYDAKHPIILPSKHHFSTLLIRYIHQSLQHGGASLVHNSVRAQFWLVGNARGTIRSIIRQCVRCTRYSQTNRSAPTLMGQLPPERVTARHAFEVTGLDYAGPLTVKVRGGRCKMMLKVYIAIFVCLTTKAVHIDVVDSLTTDDFLAALRRFIGRRGLPSKLMSDNGTTFVGAAAELQEISQFVATHRDTLVNFASSHNIEWSFIPPHAPEMGGLWEAGVKSFKTHFRPVVGGQVLSLRELDTIVVQIEACLNSRPLTYLSRDSGDLTPLTPGHFLIGRPLVALPSRQSNSSRPTSLQHRWSLVQQTVHQFWKRWSCEYLHTLHQRRKWQESANPPTVGEVMLIREENLSPTHWLLGRITETHPGQDGEIRVVTLRTKGSTIKRPVTRLVPLATSIV